MTRLIAHFVYCEEDAWNQFPPDACPKPYELETDQLWKTPKRVILADWYKELGNDLGWHRGSREESQSQSMSGGHIVNDARYREMPSQPFTAGLNVAGCSLQMHFNDISSDDAEARCLPLLNNFLEASSGHCGNYLYVRPLKYMSTHRTSWQPAP